MKKLTILLCLLMLLLGQPVSILADSAGGGGGGGTGSGDVTGPATNTANRIPQWDGADSKKLKDGLDLDTDCSSVSASDDSVCSAKTTKAQLDLKFPNYQDYTAFATGTTTPAIVTGVSRYRTASTTAKTYAYLSGGSLGQVVFIYAYDSNTTFDCTGSAFFCNNGVNYTAEAGDMIQAVNVDAAGNGTWTLTFEKGGQTSVVLAPVGISAYMHNVTGTDYERATFKWDTNVYKMLTEAGGKGTARSLFLGSAANLQLQAANEAYVLIGTSANGLAFYSGPTYYLLTPMATATQSLGQANYSFKDFFQKGIYYNYNVEGTDYERFYGKWTTNVFHIGAEKGGSGTVREITFDTTVNATTQSAGNNSTKLATTAYADAVLPTGTSCIVQRDSGGAGVCSGTLRTDSASNNNIPAIDNSGNIVNLQLDYGLSLSGTTIQTLAVTGTKISVPAAGSWTGTVMNVTLANVETAPVVMTFDASGNVVRALADANTTLPAICLLVSGGAAGTSQTCLMNGIYKWATSPTFLLAPGVSRVLIVSQTSGGLVTSTSTTTSTTYIQRIGVPLTADTAYLKFDLEMVKVP